MSAIPSHANRFVRTLRAATCAPAEIITLLYLKILVAVRVCTLLIYFMYL